MESQRVDQSDFAHLRRNAARSPSEQYDRAAPQHRIVNIDIFWRNVEIAADDEALIFLLRKAIAQPHSNI